MMNQFKPIAYLLIIPLLAIILVPTAIYAQDSIGPQPPSDFQEEDQQSDTTGIPTDPFDISLNVGRQSAWTGKVPIEVEFTPRFNSSRTQVAWDAPSSLEIDKRYDDYFPAAEGETIVVKANVKPSSSGTYTLTVTIIDWGYGRNVSSSEDVTLTFDEDLVSQPEAANYTLFVFIRYGVIIILLASLLVGLYIGGKRSIGPIKQWLQPPE